MEIIITLISFLGIILAITIHEFAHALAADKLGDPTPRAYGRLSLNPLTHLDPIGTILLPILAIISRLPLIGWAKPTPIDPYNFHSPRRDEIIVSLAGPASNLILAFIFSLFPNFYTYLLASVNIYLALFNLLPIPPLDGSKVLLNLLPEHLSRQWQQTFERTSYLIIFLLLFTGILPRLLNPVYSFLMSALF